MDKVKRDVYVDLPNLQEDHSLNAAVKGTIAALFYAVCSVSSGLISKGLLDTMGFDYPVIIMVTQMMLTIVTLEVLTILRIIHIPRYTVKRGMTFAAPAFFYGTNAILALTALSHMNIAMYGVLKRCVPVSTLFLSMIILKKGPPSRQTIFFVILLTIGCVIAGYGDMGFNLTAYICGIGSNFTHALYLILVQQHAEQHLSVAETMQLNSYNTLPLLAITAIVNGEVSRVRDYASIYDFRFVILFTLSVSVGMLLNYSLFLCTSLTSALTTSVTGGVKALVQTLIGILTFGGVSYNVSTFMGISMNLAGCVGYIWTKYKENQAKSGISLKKVMSLTALGGGGGGGDQTSKGSKRLANGSSSLTNLVSNGSLHKIHQALSNSEEQDEGH